MKNEILAKTAALFGIDKLGLMAAIHEGTKVHFNDRECLPTKPRGKTYPEQSDRQKFRGWRRAQGGPGLDTSNHPRVEWPDV